MKKIFCDSCKEQAEYGYHKFEVPIHIIDSLQGVISGYEDMNGNAVSGRMEKFDLCNKCYNEAMLLAYASIAGANVHLEEEEDD